MGHRVCVSASFSREKKGKEAYSKAGAEQREAWCAQIETGVLLKLPDKHSIICSRMVVVLRREWLSHGHDATSRSEFIAKPLEKKTMVADARAVLLY